MKRLTSILAALALSGCGVRKVVKATVAPAAVVACWAHRSEMPTNDKWAIWPSGKQCNKQTQPKGESK